MSSDRAAPKAAPAAVADKAGPQPLPDATRGKMESSFGADFSSVRVHSDSPHTAGAHAFTRGDDVHFAPGQFAPGSEKGDWLIGHELAHVVQQRKGSSGATQKFDPHTQRGLLEADADRAATAVVGGGRAAVEHGAAAGSTQKYEAWEHAQLGDANGGGDLKIYVGKNPQVPVSYGQLVALSGDFYPSAEALYDAPGGEIQKILDTMKKEKSEAEENTEGNKGKKSAVDGSTVGPSQQWDRNANDFKGGYVDVYGAPSSAQAAQNNADYDKATFEYRTLGGRSVREDHAEHGDEEHDHDHTQEPQGPAGEGPNGNFGKHEDGGKVADPKQDPSHTITGADGFTDLAKKNSSHFSPENIKLNWAPRHRDALVMAQQAFKMNHPDKAGGVKTPDANVVQSVQGKAPETEAQQGDNSKQQQAAGHAAAQKVVDGQKDKAQDFGKAGQGPGSEQAAKALVMSGFSVHFLTDAFASGHLISGNVGRDTGGKWWAQNSAAVKKILVQCARQDVLRRHTSDRSVAAAMSSSTVTEKIVGIVENQGGDGAVNGMLLKCVHDTLNASGLMVKNRAGAEWLTYGDGNMARSPETRLQGEAAAIAARQSILKTIETGEFKESEDEDGAYSAIRFVPKDVRDPKGTWHSVEGFACSPEMFQDEFSLIVKNPNPDANRMYQILKGNIYPQVESLLWQEKEKGVDAVKDKAHHAWDWMKDKAGAAKKAASGAYQKGKEKAHSAWDWTKKKAGDLKDGVEKKAGDLKNGVEKKAGDLKDGVEKKAAGAWDWTKKKAGDLKDGAAKKVDSAEHAVEGVKDGAKSKVKGWVADLFKSKATPTPQGESPALEQGTPTKVDSQTKGVPQIDNQTYAHGVFMGAAGELMKDAKWNGIFRTLMPAEHAHASTLTDAKALIAYLENNPVMAAYGSAKHLESKGGGGEKANEANPKKDGAKPLALEWDTWLDDKDPGDLSKAHIAHGGKGTTVGQALVKDLPVGLVRDDVKSAPTGSDWMNLFGRAIAMARGDDAKSPAAADDKQKKLEEVSKVTSADEAMKICAQFLQQPSGLILDIKSTYSTAQDINKFINRLRAQYGIHILGIGTFRHEQLKGLDPGNDEKRDRDFRPVKFFHGVDGLVHAAHASKGVPKEKAELAEGDHVMFNAGSLLVSKSGGKGFDINRSELQKLVMVQQQFKLKIAVYVQETEVGADAIALITKMVNSMPNVFSEGFAYGNVDGKAEGSTSGSGLGAQKTTAGLETAKTWVDSAKDKLKDLI